MEIEDKLKLILLEEFDSEPSKIQSYLSDENSLIKVMKALNRAFDLGVVSRSLPTNADYLSEVRVKLFDEHVERLSKQTKEWNLMEGIRLGLNAEKI